MYYVYLMKSLIRDECYVGSTNNLKRRIVEHNNGLELSTRRYRPWSLIYYEAYRNEKDARARESKLKHHGKGMQELKKRLIESLKNGGGLPSTILSKPKNGAGFTLIEMLIVISIIAILASVVLYANITSSAQKARDSKRKQDLNKLVRTFEDYYNDHGRYPPANDPADGNIAGSPWGSSLDNYVVQLPNDPLSPNRYHVYYYQAGSGGKFYTLYTRLENIADDDIIRVGCQNGCGPMDDTGYRAFNYFVSSGDVIMANGIPNGEDPGAIHGAPTATPVPPTAGGPTPTPNCPIGIPGALCCGNNECCQSSLGKYCGSNQCPGDNNKCLFSMDQYTYLCSYAPATCY